VIVDVHVNVDPAVDVIEPVQDLSRQTVPKPLAITITGAFPFPFPCT
jgi:hypothetical protein